MTGKPLFSTAIFDRHKRFLREGVTGINTDDQGKEVLFWQIAMFVGQIYPPAVLNLEFYPFSDRFFNHDGQLYYVRVGFEFETLTQIYQAL